MLAVILIITATSIRAQDRKIQGQIIDKETRNPVVEAHVTTTNGLVVVTDDSGLFELEIPKPPTVIRITHITYGIIEYQVDTSPKGTLVIQIEARTSNLDEIQISGERLRILTKTDNFSIQEFEIDQGVIWFLGHMNNQANRQRLFLANLYGDTLKSIPVKRAQSLYQDVFDNIHIIFKDSSFQLFNPAGDSILFLYPIETTRFFNIMGDVLAAFNNKLIFKQEMPGSYAVKFYYLQQDDPVQHVLTVMTDTLEADREWVTNKKDRLMAIYRIPELANMWKTVLRYTKRGTKFDQVIRHHVPFELFHTNNDLYIINYLNDSLLCYSIDGKFVKGLPIKFHKEMFLAGTDYKDLTFLIDPISQNAYLLERYMTRWVLSQINLATGKKGTTIPLPDYSGMDGIYVYDNAVYFTYHEKLHPYYTRLYRYQL